ncbi:MULTISPECIES: ABC transporter permease [Hymenobacter]|uniref:Nitrate ABC transporter permease n=1 Tax=Hymenobacter jejuensis TaxID=2502781 RepID=A0A5B8A497_9BACT|nr:MULTISPECIES: nitrate ABC transporter permease [Hymenobacter]MBC6989965.1 nitrate ABC transporter permease [Hymenobacter sp. BT491]QDA61999.1 nitrate ABC transporter permease [Hymenobacter jejuensis]
MKELFSPNANPRRLVFTSMVAAQAVVLLLLWLFYPLQLFPSLGDVFRSLGDLISSQGLIQELWASMTTALQSLAIATVLALLISYLTALPFFRPIAYAATKMRYLTLTGLTFFMALMVSSGHEVKLSVLIFGATVYLVTGMTSVILTTTQEEMDHARTLGMSEWRSFWEVVVLGKLDEMLEVVRQNFAIIWTMITLVETLYQSEGGIGLLLYKQNRYLHLDGVVAIQLVILATGALQDYVFVLLRRVFFPYSSLTTAK